jgi:hypothetical protein
MSKIMTSKTLTGHSRLGTSRSFSSLFLLSLVLPVSLRCCDVQYGVDDIDVAFYTKVEYDVDSEDERWRERHNRDKVYLASRRSALYSRKAMQFILVDG